MVARSLEHPELFARLYDRYAPDIHRYAARRLGDGAADDSTSDTFLVAFRIRSRYVLSAEVMPSKGLASLYRALAALPGGSVVGHLVETASGRRAIALEYHTRDPCPGTEETLRDQWPLDPQTYRVLGMRMLVGEKVVGGNSLVATAVVDKAGERG